MNVSVWAPAHRVLDLWSSVVMLVEHLMRVQALRRIDHALLINKHWLQAALDVPC